MCIPICLSTVGTFSLLMHWTSFALASLGGAYALPGEPPRANAVVSINSKAPTRVLCELLRVLVIQAEALACVLEMLSTDHLGNSRVARRWMSCALWCLPLHCGLETVRREQGCPMEMEGRMDRNSPTVLLAAFFQCFAVQHLLNKMW